jgi:DNA-binding response OmpR family regulator
MTQDQVRKVLLVDGEPEYVDCLQRALRQRGFLTCTARDGAAGLLAAHSERPDLMVLDTEIPVISGYQVLQALRSDPNTRQMAVILLAPRGGEKQVVRGWLTGADACLPREVGFEDLSLMIERILQPKQAPACVGERCDDRRRPARSSTARPSSSPGAAPAPR